MYKFKNNILILGTGAYSNALANNFSSKFDNVYLYGIDENEINDININHKNQKYFKDLSLYKNIKATQDINKYIDLVDYILIALPTSVVENVLLNVVLPNLKKPVVWINASKGFEANIPIIEDYLDTLIPIEKTKGNFKIIGATFADELAHQKPALLTLTSNKSPKNDNLIELLTTKTLKIEWCDHFEAVNFFSIFKNIYAILQGILNALDYGPNTSNYLLIESIKELSDIYKIFNNKNLTVDDLLKSATFGDFILTNTSSKSRNYSFGFSIVKNKNLDYLKNNTVEGYTSIITLFQSNPELLKNKKILKFIYNVIITQGNEIDLDLLFG